MFSPELILSLCFILLTALSDWSFENSSWINYSFWNLIPAPWCLQNTIQTPLRLRSLFDIANAFLKITFYYSHFSSSLKNYFLLAKYIMWLILLDFPHCHSEYFSFYLFLARLSGKSVLIISDKTPHYILNEAQLPLLAQTTARH